MNLKSLPVLLPLIASIGLGVAAFQLGFTPRPELPSSELAGLDASTEDQLNLWLDSAFHFGPDGAFFSNISAPSDRDSSLVETFAGVRLSQVLDQRMAAPADVVAGLRARQAADGCFSDPAWPSQRNLLDTVMAADALYQLGQKPTDEAGLIACLLRFRQDDGGFTSDLSPDAEGRRRVDYWAASLMAQVASPLLKVPREDLRLRMVRLAEDRSADIRSWDRLSAVAWVAASSPPQLDERVGQDLSSAVASLEQDAAGLPGTLDLALLAETLRNLGLNADQARLAAFVGKRVLPPGGIRQAMADSGEDADLLTTLRLAQLAMALDLPLPKDEMLALLRSRRVAGGWSAPTRSGFDLAADVAAISLSALQDIPANAKLDLAKPLNLVLQRAMDAKDPFAMAIAEQGLAFLEPSNRRRPFADYRAAIQVASADRDPAQTLLAWTGVMDAARRLHVALPDDDCRLARHQLLSGADSDTAPSMTRLHALAALANACGLPDAATDRVSRGIAGLRGPDGGYLPGPGAAFGTVEATKQAVESLRWVGDADGLDVTAVLAFLDACRGSHGYYPLSGRWRLAADKPAYSKQSLTATHAALRTRALLASRATLAPSYGPKGLTAAGWLKLGR